MKRRAFLAGAASAAVAPFASAAAAPDASVSGAKILGVLIGFAESDPEGKSRLAALIEGLAGDGWTIGSDLLVDVRWTAGDNDKAALLAAELVDLRPDVLVSMTTPPTRALAQATQTIPIVFSGVSDPVGAGFVSTFAHPGGHITGFTNLEASIAEKWAQMLKQIDPAISRAAFLYNPLTAPGGGPFYLKPFTQAARSNGIEPMAAAVTTVEELTEAIAAMAEPRGGIVVNSDLFLIVNRVQIIEQIHGLRLPAVYPYAYFVTDGGLLSYGVETLTPVRLSAGYVGRILRGMSPGDLPVQAPTRFELAINLATAEAEGFSIPGNLLSLADRVIE